MLSAITLTVVKAEKKRRWWWQSGTPRWPPWWYCVGGSLPSVRKLYSERKSEGLRKTASVGRQPQGFQKSRCSKWLQPEYWNWLLSFYDFMAFPFRLGSKDFLKSLLSLFNRFLKSLLSIKKNHKVKAMCALHSQSNCISDSLYGAPSTAMSDFYAQNHPKSNRQTDRQRDDW